jgi:ABC-type multidrug transport system fused ATPase/permease subunit
VAIVGSSGAGKSTLVDLLIGLHVVDSGEILVDGVNLVDLKRKDWLRLIGVVDQETFLLNASVRDNICFGSTVSEELMISTAVTARAHEFIMDLPQQYETFIGDRGFMLSGGQRQRLALTRALVREPEILILDEATSALDSETERAIQATLETLHGMKTIILIAHRLATVARADRVLVLDSGRLVEDGTVEELRNGGGRFSQLWEMQSLDTLQTTGVSYRGV